MKKWIYAGAALWFICQINPGFTYSELHDEYNLDIKGYSREMIEPIQHMIDRMEGRYPERRVSHIKQAWYNLLNNEWTDPLEPFTYDRIDQPRFPVKPNL